METPAEIRHRWSYLRDLLIQQLNRLEDGTFRILSDSVDVSPDAIRRLKKEILDFDTLIARSESRDPTHPRP
jgi:hypothetical protein